MSQETEYFNGLTTDEAKHQRCFMRRVILALLIGGFIFASVIYGVSGCAQRELPVCEKYQGQLVQNEDGTPGVFIDMDNVKKLAKLITGLNEGTCRIAAPEAQGKPM